MWKESYRLGVERIDKQHQKLFKMTGALSRQRETVLEKKPIRRRLTF